MESKQAVALLLIGLPAGCQKQRQRTAEKPPSADDEQQPAIPRHERDQDPKGAEGFNEQVFIGPCPRRLETLEGFPGKASRPEFPALPAVEVHGDRRRRLAPENRRMQR